MQTSEWNDLTGIVRDQVRGIIRAQQIHRTVLDAVDERNRAPLEDDFIDADLQDDAIGVPKYFEVDGVRITTRKLHRRGIGARDIAGADLLYEIEDEKYVLIQYKIADARGRVARDDRQLQCLISNCPALCGHQSQWAWCGSWHAVRSPTVSFYHHACDAQAIFAGAASKHINAFASGISKGTFDELFALCWIGTPIDAGAIASLTTDALNSDKVVFAVQQRGAF